MPRKSYSPEYKLRIVDAYDHLDREGRRRLLEREGLYPSHISQWRARRNSGALAALARGPGRPLASDDERDARDQRRELRQLREELAEAREVIAVQGKLSALLSGLACDSATPSERGR